MFLVSFYPQSTFFVFVIGICWIIGQQTIAERNVDGVEFRMKQTKYVLCTLKNLF